MEKNRDINLEIFRIICCIYVLCNHILSRYAYSSNITANSIMHFLGSLNRMAVPGFFLITGYFLFRKEKSYKYILKKSFKLFFPAFIVIIITQILDPYFMGNRNVIDCLSSIDIKKTISSILNYSSDICKNTQFLFFVFEYIELLLFYPIYNLICKDTDNCKKIRKYLILYTFITQLILPNIFEFIPNFSIALPQLIRIKYMYVFIGYDLYLYMKKNQFKLNVKGKLFCFFVYIEMGVLQTILFSYKKHLFPSSDTRFMTSESFTITISTIVLFLLIKSIDFSKISIKTREIIVYISKQTYGIYLLHWIIMIYLFSTSLNDILFEKIGNFSSVIIVIICFVISFIITVIVGNINKLILKLGCIYVKENKR